MGYPRVEAAVLEHGHLGPRMLIAQLLQPRHRREDDGPDARPDDDLTLLAVAVESVGHRRSGPGLHAPKENRG